MKVLLRTMKTRGETASEARDDNEEVEEVHAGGGFGGDRRGLPRGFRRARIPDRLVHEYEVDDNGDDANADAPAPPNAANATRQRCI